MIKWYNAKKQKKSMQTNTENNNPQKKGLLISIALIIVVLTLLFQGFHFFEHIIQLGHWLFYDRSFAYMSPWVMTWVMKLGAFFWPEITMNMQMHLGMELIHLIGNSIFFIGTLGLYFFVKNKASKWALIIQGVHLYEHISLTVSAIAIRKSIGVSTFFGFPVDAGFLVGYRVLWHFLFNLIPSVLVMLVLFKLYQKRKQNRQHESEITEPEKFYKFTALKEEAEEKQNKPDTKFIEREDIPIPPKEH